MAKGGGRRPEKVEIKYLKSAVLPQDFPPPDRLEIAIAGRSNSGKSSFINALTGGAVAKVSQNPGKTRLLNFFDVGRHYRLVDMPGYGWAARDLDEISQWHTMIETYLATRGNLAGLLLLVDCKREWTQDEAQLEQFLNNVGKPMIVLMSKVDRLRPNEIKKVQQSMSESARGLKVFPISSQEDSGIKEVERWFFDEWIKNGLPAIEDEE